MVYKKICEIQTNLTDSAGTGDRIRTNDTPGMKFSELETGSVFYYYINLKKGQHLDIVIYSYHRRFIFPEAMPIVHTLQPIL